MVSAAKLSAGALRIGNSKGLGVYANGTPENQTGERLAESAGCEDGGDTGITVADVSRSGK